MSINVACSFAFLGMCVSLLGCAGDSLGDLIARLRDPDVEVRRTAVRALNEQPIADDRAIASLANSASDDDTEVRYLSIEALGKIGPAAKPSLPALKSALEDSERDVRLRAALAIHRIDPHDRSFIPTLTNAMREGDGKTLLEVGAMGADAAWAVPTLIGLLSHESAKVRVLAANDLGGIGPAAASAKAALQTALRDSNAAVKRAAQQALERIEAKSAGVAK